MLVLLSTMHKLILVLTFSTYTIYGRRMQIHGGGLAKRHSATHVGFGLAEGLSSRRHKTGSEKLQGLGTVLLALNPTISWNRAATPRALHVPVSHPLRHAALKRRTGCGGIMAAAKDDDETSAPLTQGEKYDGGIMAAAKDADETSAPLGQTVGEKSYGIVSRFANFLVERPKDDEEERKVAWALRRMNKDVNLLDNFAGKTPQLKRRQSLLLGGAIAGSFASPFLLPHVIVEYLVPALAFLPLAVAANSEYKGKVAVARGKEISAVTLKAAAEAEELFAQGEREKAIIGVCVGVSATFAALALLVPDLVNDLAAQNVPQTALTQITLLPPLVASIFAAVSSLSSQLVSDFSNRAVGVGARRFASSEEVRRTWLSAPQMIERTTLRAKSKWTTFFASALPAPFLAILFPGDINEKAIVCSALAAAQAALSLSSAEFDLSRAAKSVAEKSRSAAVSETYSKQADSAGAILPYTTAAAGLSAAITVALIEALPLVPTAFGAAVVATLFPAIGALCASSASITTACCEIDASAAGLAATTLAESDLPLRDGPRNPIEETLFYMKMNLARLLRFLRGGRKARVSKSLSKSQNRSIQDSTNE